MATGGGQRVLLLGRGLRRRRPAWGVGVSGWVVDGMGMRMGMVGGPRTHTKFMRHDGLDEPVSREENIGLGSDGLGQLEEEPGGLGQALRRKEDGVLELNWESAEGASLE